MTDLDKDACPICRPSLKETSSKENNLINSNDLNASSKKSIDQDSWVCCDICSQWFHPDCVGITPYELDRIFSYHCDSCKPEHGPSELRRQLKRARVQIDYVALNQGDLFAVDKSEHPHVTAFLDFKPAITAKSKQNYVSVVNSDELTTEYVLSTGLTKPILIPSVNEDSGMILPTDRSKITVKYITEQTGGEEIVEVMDVLSQQSETPSWNLQKWCDYFYTPAEQRDRIRNVISLEVSDVEKLGKNFRRPKMVEEMDMVDSVWNLSYETKEMRESADIEDRPKVTTYCLMSVKASYTDFHIDFSGTPVYYTICQGEKEFVMFPPSKENLQLYEYWCLEEEQNHMWFCDYEKKFNGKLLRPTGGFKVKLQTGALFIIPSGWIHSVYTPCDTVVIGGNYLTFMDIPMHLKIYDLERRTGVPGKYRFPKFNKVMWLASVFIFERTKLFVSLVQSDDYSCLFKNANKGEVDRSEKRLIIKRERTPEEDQKSADADLTKPKIVKSQNSQNSSAYSLVTPSLLDLEVGIEYPSKPKEILSLLIEHLKRHYTMSKESTLAKKSIPYKIIGRNVPAYLEKLTTLKDTL